MRDALLIPLGVLYLLLLGALFAYGLNFFYLTWRALVRPRPDPAAPALREWPRVTVQLPIYNELYVAERLIAAAAQLDYAPGRLEIQVLDDSTDETFLLVRAAVARWQARGVNVLHLPRKDRTGYKAGALAYGLSQARGEFIAIFDADFIPPADFLRRTVPHFHNRPRLAFVQTRWGHVNAPDSLLTRVQALAIDAHFAIEQGARSVAGFIFNFNGTAGVWRRAAMEAAGGWRADTLTEDLDLSYRAFLRGWEALYLNEVRVPAELPATFAAYRRQQRRWALGSLQCARNLLPQVWSGPLSLASKVQATLHLTAYGIHLLMLALSLLYPFILWLSVQYPDVLSLFGLGYVFNLTVLAPTALFLAGQRRLGQGSRRALPLVLFLSIFGAGMMVNTLWAALQLFGPPRPFERTPKAGDQSLHAWLRGRYPLQLDRLVWVEFGFLVWNLGTALLAASLGNWVIAFYALLFAIGLAYVSGSSVLQALTLWHARKSPRAAPPQSL